MISDKNKYELIEVLARNCKGRMGRTALMKFLFFLQTLRRMPLGYRFTLYSYGPFDSDVLSDLGEAELLGYIESNVLEYSGGYGYEIEPTEPPSESSFLQKYDVDIKWVINNFGSMNSAQLELASTIIYADREEPPHSRHIRDLVKRVKNVKPHFSEDKIREQVESLHKDDLLRSIK